MGLITTAVTVLATAAYLKQLYTTAAPADNTGNSFRFPYTAAPTRGLIKDVSDPSRNIYVTRISNDNLYYINNEYGGLSGAIPIDNNKLISKINKSKYTDVLRLKTGTTLANCVGWAHGRVNEIWGTAVSTGYIKRENDKWVIASTGQEVICGAAPNMTNTPRCDAYSFYDKWPVANGWTKSTRFEDDLRPCPGAIICWKNMRTANGLCGHVAVVEAVYNYGQADEYIVISQSGYSSIGAQKIVWTQVIKRSNYINGAPYGYSLGYKFAGFLYSPVCELLYANGAYTTTQASYTGATPELIEADMSTYEKLNKALANQTVEKELRKGQEVRITWFGVTDPDSDNKVNLLGSSGTIVSIDNSKAYPYAVSITGDGVISGYFTREALTNV